MDNNYKSIDNQEFDYDKKKQSDDYLSLLERLKSIKNSIRLLNKMMNNID